MTGCSVSSKSCSGLMTLSEADSILFRQLICSFESIIERSLSSNCSCGKLAISLRIVQIKCEVANTGLAGMQKATNTPAMVG